MLYSELQCSEAIHKAVERMGFAEMTEVQEKTLQKRSWQHRTLHKCCPHCPFLLPVFYDNKSQVCFVLVS